MTLTTIFRAVKGKWKNDRALCVVLAVWAIVQGLLIGRVVCSIISTNQMTTDAAASVIVLGVISFVGLVFFLLVIGAVEEVEITNHNILKTIKNRLKSDDTMSAYSVGVLLSIVDEMEADSR